MTPKQIHHAGQILFARPGSLPPVAGGCGRGCAAAHVLRGDAGCTRRLGYRQVSHFAACPRSVPDTQRSTPARWAAAQSVIAAAVSSGATAGIDAVVNMTRSQRAA
jgi:hypothetical protein